MKEAKDRTQTKRQHHSMLAGSREAPSRGRQRTSRRCVRQCFIVSAATLARSALVASRAISAISSWLFRDFTCPAREVARARLARQLSGAPQEPAAMRGSTIDAEDMLLQCFSIVKVAREVLQGREGLGGPRAAFTQLLGQGSAQARWLVRALAPEME